MFRLSLRMTWRDWRAGELRFLLLSLIIAVASLAAVGFFMDRMRATLQRDAHQLLGADLLISADQPVKAAWREAAQAKQFQLAETIVFPSMAITGEGENLKARLVSLKAVSAKYPLRGNLKLLIPQANGTSIIQVTHDIPALGSAWLDPVIMTAMHLQLGDQIKLGDKKFSVAGIIKDEPDRGAAFVNFAPRVMLNQQDLAATNLIQDGSRVTYRLLVAGEAVDIAQFEKTLKAEIEHDHPKGVRIESLESGRPEMQATLNRAEQFLSLVGVLSALLASLAVAMAARRFMLRHLDAYAMLRCLGQTQTQVTIMYLLEFVLLGFIGSALGVVLGYAAHYVLLEILGKMISDEIPAASFMPAWQGLGMGILLLVGFALPPILQMRDVPLNRVIRREQEPPKASSVLTYLFGLVMFLGLLLWRSGDLKLSLITATGFLLGMLLFAGVAWLSLRAIRHLRGLSRSTAWRFALTALQRRPAASIAQIVSLSLGLMALLLLTLVRADLLDAWKKASPVDAPNQFMINIQPDQEAQIAERLQPFGQPSLYPMIRGRLVEINGAAISDKSFADDQAKRLADREFNLSTMKEIPLSNKIVQGKWLDDTKPEASVEEGIAKTLHLKLGDTMTFDIAGQRVSAPITSLRKLDWGSMRVNFFVILNPQLMRDQPRTLITAFHLPEENTQFTNRLSADFPNLTVVDVGSMLKQVQDVLDQVVRAVEFLFLFTLASGVLVLYAALAGSQDVRIREAALLRALGATRSQLSQSQWIEFILIGGLSGILAASGASIIGWLLAHYVFQFEWQFSVLVWLSGFALGAVCALTGAWFGLRKVLERPPLQSLREA